jgi:Protein of unknown function (DUF3347).
MYRLLFAAFCCLSLWACNTATDKAKLPTKAVGQAQSKLGNPLTAEAVSLLHEYYNLKDALIEGLPNDADMAAQKATSIIASLKTRMSNNTSDTAGISRMASLDTMQIGLSQILTYKDETCEIKRVHFEKVSNGIIQFVKTIELKDSLTIYFQYCPMALNDKGAYWLSNSAEVRNPYFGKKMLECGEVVETIQ